MITIPGIDSYFGGKGASGVPQMIINQMPPHDSYIELFLGGGAIIRTKKPAPKYNIGIELNREIANLWHLAKFNHQHSFIIHNMDTFAFLAELAGNTFLVDEFGKIFIYADPPYLLTSRRQKRNIYKHEFTEADHIRLLEYAITCPHYMAISCYPNTLYPEYLKNWRYIDYTSQTRRGQAIERLYMNYPQPERLHDYSFLGNDFRERERIRKKILRHVHGLKRLPLYERQAILEAINTKI